MFSVKKKKKKFSQKNRQRVYIFNKKEKKIRFKNFKKNADIENYGASKGFGFIYILVIGPCVARFYEKAYKINV